MKKRDIIGAIYYNAVFYNDEIYIHELKITNINNLAIRAKVKIEGFEYDIEPTVFDLKRYSNSKEEALEKLWQVEFEKFDESQGRWNLFCKHYNEKKDS